MDYKQTTVSGAAWHRFSEVTINNPLGKQPTVSCVEQQVVAVADQNVVAPAGYLRFDFDAAASFPLLNPLTNEPMGQDVTGAQVYAMVYSYVMAEAAKRDQIAAAADAAAAAAAAAQAQQNAADQAAQDQQDAAAS